MSELVSPVVDENLEYEGYFSMKEVFRIIDKYFRQRGFDKKIIFDEEYHTPTGKYIHVKMEPYKKWDDYVRMQIRLWIYAKDMVEVEREVDGQKIKTEYGKLYITFDSFLQTDYRHRWDSKPAYFLIRTLIEKYLMGGRLKNWEDMSRYIIQELRSTLSGYLNTNKQLYI
jgi:hypothetical protein